MQKIEKLDYKTRESAMREMIYRPKNEPEMSEFESAFLCGLLEKFRPKKIVEVGVAAGGTTSIILKKLEEREDSNNIRMFSCDLSKEYYRHIEVNGEYRNSGFMADSIKEKTKVKHEFLLGEPLPKFLSKIGEGIDFIVLDTAHSLPGEVIDFLAILPYMSEGGIVVLHDISYHLRGTHKALRMATNALFNAVAAEKILNFVPEEDGIKEVFPDIGAFKITADTYRYIENIFGILTLQWVYLPNDDELHSYRECYKKHYDNLMLHLFDEAIRANKKLLINNKVERLPLKKRIRKAAHVLLKE